MSIRNAAVFAATALFLSAGAAAAASNSLCKSINNDPADGTYVAFFSPTTNATYGQGYDFNDSLACLGVFNGADRTTSNITDTVGTTATTATVGGDDMLADVTTSSYSFGRSEIEHNEFIINELNAFNFDDWDLVDEVVTDGGTANTFSQNSTFAGSGYGLSVTSLASQLDGAKRHNYFGSWEVADFQDAQRAAIVMLNENDQWAIYLLDGVEAQTGFWTTNQASGSLTHTSDGWSQVENKSYGYNLASMQLYVSRAEVVPVPAAAPLLLGGLAAMVWVRRRKA